MPLTGDPWLVYNSDGTVPACRRSAPVGVFRYDGASTLFALPNVECLSISRKEGTDPGSAHFRYNLASGLAGAPYSIETALGTGFVGAYTVNTGDRLVVQGERPDGSVECLFDGDSISFAMGIDSDLEEVEVGAVGIAWHCWDDVIPGALQRNAGAARVVADTPTDLPAVFNANGLPNCTPDGYMAGSQSGSGDYRYPTFLDPLVIQKGGGTTDARTFWTLSKALRYLLFNANPTQRFVLNPDGQFLDGLLVSPGTGGDTSAPIRCPDTPITGKDWPGTVSRLVSECGFGTYFGLSTSGGLPVTSYRVFLNQSGPVKSLYLGPRGTNFDARLFNFQNANLHRDVSEVATQITVKGGLDRWEASFILAAGFPMASGDSSAGTLPTFDSGDPLYLTTNTDKYRLYIFDETSDGHYAIGSSTLVPTATSLDGLFGGPVNGLASYCRRRRPGLGTLISVDPTTNRKFEARISISTDYAGPSPGLWDGSGHWQAITSTTWHLLQDRLGVALTDSNPNNWQIGPSKISTDPFPTGVVNGVERQASLVAGKSFYIRLTCVVEGDHAVTKVATPRGGSPLPRTINRIVDASDRYRNEYVDFPSELNATGNNDLNPRDDGPDALAEAQALRANQESGVLEGHLTIPRLTTYYQIGDRIDQIEGRNLGLRTDQGSGAPVYPVVVGVHHDFSADGQSTTLDLSDAGTHRARYSRPPSRRDPRTPRVRHAHARHGKNGYAPPPASEGPGPRDRMISDAFYNTELPDLPSISGHDAHLSDAFYAPKYKPGSLREKRDG